MKKKIAVVMLMGVLAMLVGCASYDDEGDDVADTVDTVDTSELAQESLVANPTPVVPNAGRTCTNYCSQNACYLNCYNQYLTCLYGYGYNPPGTSAFCSSALQQCDASCATCCLQ